MVDSWSAGVERKSGKTMSKFCIECGCESGVEGHPDDSMCLGNSPNWSSPPPTFEWQEYWGAMYTEKDFIKEKP